METQLDLFQTLADPTRRSIVEALRNGERQVNDIVEQAGVHQSGVSRHLRILQEAGFVSMRPEDSGGFTLSGRTLSANSTSGWRSTAICGKHALTAWSGTRKATVKTRKAPDKEHET